ncbi:MAG: YHS domain-containing protein [Chloroflexi bacterium]|nr:YHS domain-containing protein [Chloroflexota bacterium]
MAIDPVCNMVVDERQPPATSTVAGRTYYFCALACKQAFLELGLGDEADAPPSQLVDSRGNPAVAQAIPTGSVTILFTDVQDSTQLIGQLGEESAQAVMLTELGRQQQLVQRHAGYAVKRLGDGVMAAFAEPGPALACAVDVQSHDDTDAKLPVRIGLHAGEVIVEDADYYGQTVIMAARIMGRASGGEIAVSEGFRSLLDPPAGWRFGPSRKVRLKGFPGWQRILIVEQAEPANSARNTER